jgi:teichuronic acid exporter
VSGPNAVLPATTPTAVSGVAPTGAAFRTAVVGGFLWLGTGAFVGQFASWLSTILVIRLLSPSDYGLMATTTVFTSFVGMLGELGFGAALIQAKEIAERDIRQVFGWAIMTSLLAWGACHAAAPFIASFYGQPELVGLIRIMSLTIPVLALYVVPQGLNTREMNFKVKARIEFLAQLLGALATLTLAVAGSGVWSLVGGAMVFQLVKVIGYNRAYPRYFTPVFALSGSGRMFRYGVSTTAERVLSFAFTYSDIVIVGRFLGTSVLGIYSVALSLASTPMSKVLPIVTQVSFTSYARIQDDPERLQRNVLRAARVIAFIGFPVFFGMAAIAPVAIPLVLGEQWTDAVLPFQLLCLTLPLKALWPILSPAVAAVGRQGINVATIAVMAASMTLALLVGVRSGLAGVCVAWLTIYPLVFVFTTAFRLRALGVGVREYFAELRFPFFASALMLGTIYLLSLVVARPRPIFALVSIVAYGATLYAGLVLALKRQDYAELRSLVRS